MTEPPKKPTIRNIDISKLSRVRPTRVPSASLLKEVRPQITNYKKLAIHAGILCLIVLLAYGASVIGGFVFNDHYIDHFLAINFSDESFWSNLTVKALSQPLSQSWITASFVYDLQNFGFDPSWYHIVNIILHFLCCFYFYIFVYTLARYFWQDDGAREPVHEVALLAAGLLACHPFASEAVAHIVGRQATLIACNFFLTLNFFLWAFLTKKIRPMIRNYLLTFFFLIQAIFCGPQALAIPAVMLLIAVLAKPLNISYKEWAKHKWGELLVIIILFGLTFWLPRLGYAADFSDGFVLPLQSWQTYVASQFHSVVAYYLRCFLLPIGLSIFPPFSTANSFIDPLTVLGMLVLGIGIYGVYRFRKQPLAALGLAIAVFCYLPPIFFVQNEMVADWRFYLSIAGLSLFIASILKPWLSEWRSNNRIKVLTVSLLALFITGSILRSLDFRSDITLFKAATKVNQGDAWAKGMLGLALVKAHKETQGVELANKAIALDKTCQPAYYALGIAYTPSKKNASYSQARSLEAKNYLEKALALAKSQHLGSLVIFEAERDLASVLTDLGEYKEAKTIAEAALKVSANSVMLNLVMGKICNASGDYFPALMHLNKVFERDRTNPDFVEPVVEAELGVAYPQLINAAYNTAKMGISVCPTHNLRLMLAQAALATGHLNESLQWSNAALSEQPNDPRAMYLRSVILKIAGQNATAQDLSKKALAIDPGVPKKMKIVGVNKERNRTIRIEEVYSQERK
jgi:protein O-mannosyl-transferase